MVTAKVWVLQQRPQGEPELSDFKCIEEELPTCAIGDIIVEAEFLSVDPYMRYRVRELPLDVPIVGSQVARVIESKNTAFPVGKHVLAFTGWRSHSHVSAASLKNPAFLANFYILPDFGTHSRSLGLGLFGMPGNTAYFGFLELCQPKAGETVLVNGAAGAVGSAVCQIAKIKGCKVIAFAGSDDKVKWLKNLGLDHVFNYKTENISESLKKAAPEGIHCYFDNVGGKFTAEALPHIAERGRISVCGAISTYNDEGKHIGVPTLTSPFNEGTVIFRQLRIEGFIVTRWYDRWLEGINAMIKWANEGKLKYEESVTEGFENMPKAFIGLFRGENTGKAIISV